MNSSKVAMGILCLSHSAVGWSFFPSLGLISSTPSFLSQRISCRHRRSHRSRALILTSTQARDVCTHEIVVGEILEVLFPSANRQGPIQTVRDNDSQRYRLPSHAAREDAGRQAQGFVAGASTEARTLLPVRGLTYGEFNLDFFFSLVDECLSIRARGVTTRDALESQTRNLVFADVGSGCGRLVMAQALKWPWRSCLGVEKVRSLHQMGEAAISAAREMASIGAGGITGQEQTEGISSEASQVLQGMAPCDLSLGDIYDEVDVSHVDVLFCYSSSFPAQGDMLTDLSYALGHKLRLGTQVITTDRRLVSDGPWEFALLKERDGSNAGTGGKSTAYIWEVTKSAI